MRRLSILDTTLRDGEQTVGVAFTEEDKVAIALALDDFGIDDIDAGFAAVSESERAALKKISNLNLRARVTSLARAIPSDIDAVVECGLRHVGVFIALSDLHLEKKLGISEDEAFDQVAVALKHARKKGLTVRFGVEDASRTPLDRLFRFFAMARELGVETLGYADTCGIDTPETISRTFSALNEKFPDAELSVHCHDDLGLAVANSIAAYLAGARLIHVCVNGLGERAGNAPLEEVLMALQVGYGVTLDVRYDQIFDLSTLVYQRVKLERPFNKPIVGKFVFSHESGIHAHGILTDARTYEPFPPARIGRSHEILLGKHSGLKNIDFWLNRVTPGKPFTHEEKQKILLEVKGTALKIGQVTEQDFIIILRRLGLIDNPATSLPAQGI